MYELNNDIDDLSTTPFRPVLPTEPEVSFDSSFNLGLEGEERSVRLAKTK